MFNIFELYIGDTTEVGTYSLLIRNSFRTRLTAIKILKQGLLNRPENKHMKFLLRKSEWKGTLDRPRHRY